MRGEKHLLLLAAFTVLATCQPKVSLSPPLKQIFIGDLLYLTCDNVSDGDSVIWYLNNSKTQESKTLKITAASLTDSGDYQCERDGQKSDTFPVKVEDFVPSASLTVLTGQPVMHTGDAIILKIEHDNGLQGWSCNVYEGGNRKPCRTKLKNNPVSWKFKTRDLYEPEIIFWFTDSTEKRRSNQVVVRTSSKPLSLEMYPLPAIAGESLTLSCVVWGAKVISQTTFYKGNERLQSGNISTYEIPNVTNSNRGQYSCRAIYKYKEITSGPPYDEPSDAQDLSVQNRPKTAVLSAADMSCSCPGCPNSNSMSYRFYEKYGESWKCLPLNQKPHKTGTYRCCMELRNMRTLPSEAFFLSGPFTTQESHMTPWVIMVILVILLVLLVGGFIIYRHKRRSTTVPIYEDVAMHQRDKGDDKYEPLQARGREGEYDALQKKGGEYEALKKEEMKDAVYHSLGAEGPTGGASGGTGESGYEALKKEGMKEGVYHTLGAEGAEGGKGGTGEGGYEALKKEGMKEGVYHTLGAEGAEGGKGEGGYEALKKEGMKEGVYHTLGAEGGQKAGGKKDDEKESEIVEL